ncbi:hypothetical protein D3C80_2070650 [compost metagenome]
MVAHHPEDFFRNKRFENFRGHDRVVVWGNNIAHVVQQRGDNPFIGSARAVGAGRGLQHMIEPGYLITAVVIGQKLQQFQYAIG